MTNLILNTRQQKRIDAYLTDFVVKNPKDYQEMFGEGKVLSKLTPDEIHKLFCYATTKDAADILKLERA